MQIRKYDTQIKHDKWLVPEYCQPRCTRGAFICSSAKRTSLMIRPDGRISVEVPNPTKPFWMPLQEKAAKN